MFESTYLTRSQIQDLYREAAQSIERQQLGLHIQRVIAPPGSEPDAAHLQNLETLAGALERLEFDLRETVGALDSE